VKKDERRQGSQQIEGLGWEDGGGDGEKI